MYRKIFYKVAAIVLALAIFSTASAEGIWRLDAPLNDELPRSFKVIDEINISGSGQPAPNSLERLYNELRRKTNGTIYIVDLREESHGFANGFPVSFYTEKNLANFFQPSDQIENIEVELLTDLLDQQVDLLPLGNEDKKFLQPVNVIVKTVATERMHAETAGFQYVRMPATDMLFPKPEIVEQLITFAQTVQPGDWVHFHCQAGHGRTATFMVMYEILKNPEKSLAEICNRYEKLEGIKLLERRIGDDYYTEAHNSRAEELIKFFSYVRSVQREEIGVSWSEFVELPK